VACSTDADCSGTTPRCLAGSGRCVACLDNADCGAARPICSSTSFTCIAGCTSNAQCTGSRAKICDPGTASCVECSADADCLAQGDGKYCNNGGCVACLRDLDCPSGQHCQTLFSLDVCQ